MGIRSSMTMRCYPERDTASTVDAWGNPVTPVWQVQTAIPCHAWLEKKQENAVQRRKINNRTHVQAIRTTYLMAIPLTADLTESDRIQKITDRQGTQIYGAMQIESIGRRSSYKVVEMIEYE